MPFVKVADAKLYYETYGQGRQLVLMHSAWASHEWWQWQVADFARIYQVYSYDARGHGKSTPLREVFSVEGFAQDLDIFLQRLQDNFIYSFQFPGSCASKGDGDWRRSLGQEIF